MQYCFFTCKISKANLSSFLLIGFFLFPVRIPMPKSRKWPELKSRLKSAIYKDFYLKAIETTFPQRDIYVYYSNK